MSASTGIGSSPRGRGIPSRTKGRPMGGRLIPAWAGNTCLARLGRGGWRAHPRVGGEYSFSVLGRRFVVGSSPRGRGIQGSPGARRGPYRLIPAWAGNTPYRGPRKRLPTAHPRVGGEYTYASPLRRSPYGSSPRGRGILPHPWQVTRQKRLIPAWAGNTPSGGTASIGLQAHPRVGGEYGAVGMLMVMSDGSSPRGRGILAFV